MKKRIFRDYQEKLIEDLQDLELASAYLNEALQDEDPRIFLLALKNVYAAHGEEMATLARKTKLSRENLYRILSLAHPQAKTLVEQTLGKTKNYILADNYMEDLSHEIAWAFITSYDFINSDAYNQWINRKGYFDSLTALWHKLFLMGHDLDFYRLAEKRYWANIAYSEVDGKHSKLGKLKSESDLCDSQLIHYATFGIKIDHNNERCPVIGITIGREGISIIKKHEHRIGICKQTLIDIKRDVESWNVNSTSGEIIILTRSKDNKVSNAHRIPFNAPF